MILRALWEENDTVTLATMQDVLNQASKVGSTPRQLLQDIQNIDKDHLGLLNISLMIDAQGSSVLNTTNAVSWLSPHGESFLQKSTEKASDHQPTSSHIENGSQTWMSKTKVWFQINFTKVLVGTLTAVLTALILRYFFKLN